jgi:hypothetical protein
LSTKIYVKPEDWDDDDQRVEPHHPRNDEYYTLIDMLQDVEDVLRRAKLQSRIISVDEVIENMDQEDSVKLVDFIERETEKSTNVKGSDSDKTTTHRMIHIGRFLNVPVWDHLIITESSYYSFLNAGLIDQLEADMSNVPDALTAETLK